MALATLETKYESVFDFLLGFSNFKLYLIAVLAIKAEDLLLEDSAKEIKNKAIESAAVNGIFLDEQNDWYLFQKDRYVLFEESRTASSKQDWITSLSLDPSVSFQFTRSNLLGAGLEELEEEAAKDIVLDEDEAEDFMEDILLHRVSNVVLGGGLYFAARALNIDILKL